MKASPVLIPLLMAFASGICSGSALAQAKLSLSTGQVGQAVWPYLTSNHPDHAIGRLQQSEIAVESGIDHRLDLLLAALRTTEREPDDGFAIEVDPAGDHRA